MPYEMRFLFPTFKLIVKERQHKTALNKSNKSNKKIYLFLYDSLLNNLLYQIYATFLNVKEMS